MPDILVYLSYGRIGAPQQETVPSLERGFRAVEDAVASLHEYDIDIELLRRLFIASQPLRADQTHVHRVRGPGQRTYALHWGRS